MYGVKCHFWESIYVSPSPEFPWLYSLDIYKSLFHCFGSWRRVQKAGNKGRWNGNDQGGMERSGYILAFFCFQAFKIIYKKENLRLGLQKEEREPEGQEQTEPRAEVPKLEGVRCVVLCTQQWALPPLANCPWTSSLRGYLEGRLGCVCRCVCVCVCVCVCGLVHGAEHSCLCCEERVRMRAVALAPGLTSPGSDGYETITPLSFGPLGLCHWPVPAATQLPEPPGPGSSSALKASYPASPCTINLGKTHCQD